MKGSAESYRVFVRNWWRLEWKPGCAGERVPDPSARKTTLATHCTLDEARRLCKEYNDTHKPGRLSRKAEFESE